MNSEAQNIFKEERNELIKQERNELIKQLNKEVEDYIASLKPQKYEDGWPEDKWEEEMEKHPMFMTKSPEGGDLPPLVEAMQQLKYSPSENTAEELAKNYKEDGNEFFREKKYHWAKDSYTEGLKQNCSDNELNVQLYTNRAAAHFHLGNYRSALKDSTMAKSLKPDHMKAIVRGGQCCWELKLYDECKKWCEEGLKIDKENSVLSEFMLKVDKKKAIVERDQRKTLAKKRKVQAEYEVLKKVIKERGVRLGKDEDPDSDDEDLSQLNPNHPMASKSHVHLNDSGDLVWPVLFLYPEYAQTDFIEQFNETTSFQDHLNIMFGSVENRPAWDKNGDYIPEKIQIYFEDNKKSLVVVKKDDTLKCVLGNKRYRVLNGTPTFFLTVKDSDCDKTFRSKYGAN